jgi:hypothetical protein
MNTKHFLTLLAAVALASCSSDGSTYAQKESPNNMFKDYKGNQRSVLGVGKTITERKAEANSTISFSGKNSLDKAITRFAKKYSLSVEWGDDVNRFKERRLTANRQTFNEARAYIEDVYDISIVRVRDRFIKVMTPSTVEKLESFNPGPNVLLSQAVNGLAELCGVNLVIAEHKDVLSTQKITTNLTDVTCTQAFDAVLNPFGLSLKENGSHYTISGLPFREWALNLHEQKRAESQKINYSSEFSGAGGEEAASNYVSGGSSSTEVSYSRDLWKSLEDDLKALVEKTCQNSQSMGYQPTSAAAPATPAAGLTTPAAGAATIAPAAAATTAAAPAEKEKSCGYVRVNPDVGLVQMQAPKTVLDQANDMITVFEDIASRRLLVEARILAVAKERSFDRGSDLNISGNIGSTDLSFGFNPTTTLKNGDSIAGTLNEVLAGATGSSLVGGGLAMNAGDLDAVVRYVQSFGTTYQLMKPTLEVMDRQRSTLIDGRNERFYIKTASVDNSGDTPITTTEAEEKIQFVGIQFAVSAQVAEDSGDLHTVSLQIPITEILRYDDFDIQTGIDSDGNATFVKNVVPIASTRVIDQKVRIRDGEIKVIGGLTKTIAVDKETGVPLLQDVPVAGKAFSEESVTYEDVEFVVLLQVKRLDN